MSNLRLFAARARLYASGPTGLSVDYVKAHQLDTRRLFNGAGCFVITRVAIDGDRFEFSDDPAIGEIAVVIEVAGHDGRTVVDLLAWPIEDPKRFVSMFGAAAILGVANVFAAATYSLGHPLVCYRAPLAWWRAGCVGAVVLKSDQAARILLDAPGKISGEDLEHSREVAELVRSLFDPSRFVSPSQERRAA